MQSGSRENRPNRSRRYIISGVEDFVPGTGAQEIANTITKEGDGQFLPDIGHSCARCSVLVHIHMQERVVGRHALGLGRPQHLSVAADEDQGNLLIGEVAGGI